MCVCVCVTVCLPYVPCVRASVCAHVQAHGFVCISEHVAHTYLQQMHAQALLSEAKALLPSTDPSGHTGPGPLSEVPSCSSSMSGLLGQPGHAAPAPSCHHPSQEPPMAPEVSRRAFSLLCVWGEVGASSLSLLACCG